MARQLTGRIACRTARNSRPLEVIGTYDPTPKADPYAPEGAQLHKDIRLDTARAKYWVGVGAQASDTAWRLLHMAGVLPPHQRSQTVREEAQKKYKVEDLKIR